MFPTPVVPTRAMASPGLLAKHYSPRAPLTLYEGPAEAAIAALVGDARTAILMTATFLVSPYTLNYDLLLLMPAAVALFRRGIAVGFYPLERLLYLILWLMPTGGMILNRLDLPIMPLVILLFGAIAWARLQAESKVELPNAAAAG